MKVLRTPIKRKKWWDKFFEVYRATGVIRIASEAAGVCPAAVYHNRRHSPMFADEFASADEEANGLLEDIATKRAAEHSDTLLIFLLKSRMRAKYGDFVRQENSGPGGGPIEHREVSRLSDRDLDARIAALEGGALPSANGRGIRTESLVICSSDEPDPAGSLADTLM